VSRVRENSWTDRWGREKPAPASSAARHQAPPAYRPTSDEPGGPYNKLVAELVISLANLLRWDASHDRPWRHILGHDGPGTNDGLLADRDARRIVARKLSHA
jgi:hypothetical protein